MCAFAWAYRRSGKERRQARGGGEESERASEAERQHVRAPGLETHVRACVYAQAIETLEECVPLIEASLGDASRHSCVLNHNMASVQYTLASCNQALSHEMREAFAVAQYRDKALLHLEAFAKATVEQAKSACGECGQARKDDHLRLLKCGQCRVLRYCTEECQRENWKVHKGLCHLIKAWADETADTAGSNAKGQAAGESGVGGDGDGGTNVTCTVSFRELAQTYLLQNVRVVCCE